MPDDDRRAGQLLYVRLKKCFELEIEVESPRRRPVGPGREPSGPFIQVDCYGETALVDLKHRVQT